MVESSQKKRTNVQSSKSLSTMPDSIFAPLLMICLPINIISPVACWTYEEEFNFRSNVLQRDDQNIRPLKNMNDTIDVSLDVNIVKINEFNIVNGQIKMQAYAYLEWYNERLFWNESLHRITEVLVSNDNIWSPAVKMYNTEDEIITRRLPYLRLLSNGSVTQWRNYNLNIFCNVNAYAFPFDKHNCETMLYFRDYDIQKVRFRKINCKMTDLLHVKWLVNFSCEIKQIHNSSQCHLTIKLARKFQLQSFASLLPLFIFFILNIMVGYLPVESGEKVTFATTVFLSNVVYLRDINKQLPKEPNTIPLIFLCHLILTFLSGMAAVGTIITSKIFWKNKSSEPVTPPKKVAENSQIHFINSEDDIDKEGDFNGDRKTTKENDLKKEYYQIESVMFYIMAFITVLFASVFTALFTESIFK